jgi:hypothetical protein
MVNVEDVNNVANLFDPVDDAIGAAVGARAPGERSEQRLADPVRVNRKRGSAKLQHSSGNSFRKSLGNRSWKRISLRCPGSVTAGHAATRQILATGGQLNARLATSQSCQALRDTGGRVGVTQDFQCHLQALKVIHQQ